LCCLKQQWPRPKIVLRGSEARVGEGVPAVNARRYTQQCGELDIAIANNSQLCANGRRYDTAHRRNTMKKIIQCPCGSVIEGDSEDDVVKKAQEHAKTTHAMELSKEQALAMARPA
jgi:predicted small metal-binding protein